MEVLSREDLGSLRQPGSEGTGLALEGATKSHIPCCGPSGAEGLCSHRGWEERGPCRAQLGPGQTLRALPHISASSAQEQVTEQGTNTAKQISAPATRVGAAQEFVI